MQLETRLKDKLVSKAQRNVKKGNQEDEASRGLFGKDVRIDLQRPRLLTESYKETEGQPMVLRRAKALAHIIHHMRVYILDWERIVGFQTEYPEGIHWPIEQMWRSVRRNVNSELGYTLVDDEGRKEVDELSAYWDGKSIHDQQQQLFTGELAKYWKWEGTFLVTHSSQKGIPDYEILFREGLQGRIKRIEARLSEIDQTMPFDYIEQKEFLQAAKIVLEATIDFARRYAVLAKEMAKKESDGERKQQLEDIARTCEWVLSNPPRTLHEALQFFFFIHVVRFLEFPTSGNGLRFDYLFGPYYEKDLNEGRLTKEQALELVELVIVKCLELGQLYSATQSSVYAGMSSLQSFCLGGVDKEGNDVTNKMSYLLLEVARRMRVIEPSISLRVHKGTPDELLSAAVDVVGTGIGYPSFLNDDVIIPLAKKLGVEPEITWNYVVDACVYIVFPGKAFGIRNNIGFFVPPKGLWWALHQGVNPKTGEQWGAKTPHPSTFSSWKDVFDAYLQQVKFFTTKAVHIENISRTNYARNIPNPFISAIHEGCIERGKEFQQWHEEHDFAEFFLIVGETNVADSLVLQR